jgi:hypothetical protein
VSDRGSAGNPQVNQRYQFWERGIIYSASDGRKLMSPKGSRRFLALLVQEKAMPELKPQLQTVDQRPVRVVEEREQPEPSSVWISAAFFFLACAVGTVTAALTLSPDAAVPSLAFWVTTPWLILIAGICSLAHLAVNRGRTVKRREIRELPRHE